MPFGTKTDAAGVTRDFDAAYNQVIAVAVEAAGMIPVRADEEMVGGWIHKPMFERLMLCDYAVADLTGQNPNVFYELGIRHALRPYSTVVIFEKGSVLPFDLSPMRGIPYSMNDIPQAISLLKERLDHARNCHDDSPLFQTFVDLPRHRIDHTKTDVFREQVEYSNRARKRLADARAKGKPGLADILALRNELGNLADAEFGTVVDLYLSLRAMDAHQEMVDLFEQMPLPIQRNRLVREQYGFALNRLKRHSEAERVLDEVIQEYGASSETNELMGRIYKDRYEAAIQEGDESMARGYLKRSIDTYLKGFEADIRDAYPGVNAVTLMELTTPPDPRQAVLLPTVRYAAERQFAVKGGDYWAHATLLELAVLGRDPQAADSHVDDAMAKVNEHNDLFAPATTARNLRLIRTRREAAGEDCAWIKKLEDQLEKKARKMSGESVPV